jgi:hypothetical protein
VKETRALPDRSHLARGNPRLKIFSEQSHAFATSAVDPLSDGGQAVPAAG